MVKMSINQLHKCSSSTSCVCQHTPCTSNFHFSVANVAGFSSLCSNEFWTLIVCILTFGPLRKCTKPQDIRSHRIRSYLYGQMPKNVVVIAVLIITQITMRYKRKHYTQLLRPLSGTEKDWITLKSFESQPASAALGLGARIFAQKEFISWLAGWV